MNQHHLPRITQLVSDRGASEGRLLSSDVLPLPPTVLTGWREPLRGGPVKQRLCIIFMLMTSQTRASDFESPVTSNLFEEGSPLKAFSPVSQGHDIAQLWGCSVPSGVYVSGGLPWTPGAEVPHGSCVSWKHSPEDLEAGSSCSSTFNLSLNQCL